MHLMLIVLSVLHNKQKLWVLVTFWRSKQYCYLYLIFSFAVTSLDVDAVSDAIIEKGPEAQEVPKTFL